MYDYSEEITNYLFGQMSELQREAFEKRLRWDKELAAEVARQQEMLDVVQAISNIKEAQEDPYYDEVDKLTTEILESRERDILKKRKTVRFIVRRIFYSAASILGLLILSRSPVKTTFTKKIDYKLRGKAGIGTKLTENFGKYIGRGISKIMTIFRKR